MSGARRDYVALPPPRREGAALSGRLPAAPFSTQPADGIIWLVPFAYIYMKETDNAVLVFPNTKA